MNPRALLRGGALAAAALLLPFAAPSVADAGTYHFDLDTSRSAAGWSFAGDGGFSGCSNGHRAGPCAAADVPDPTPLRVFALGAAAAGAEGHWW